MRPGNSASSILKRSATTSGAWFGSITPPEPTRMCFVTAAICPIMMSGAGLATRGEVVVLGQPVADIAEPIGMLAPDRCCCGSAPAGGVPVVTTERSRTGQVGSWRQASAAQRERQRARFGPVQACAGKRATAARSPLVGQLCD